MLPSSPTSMAGTITCPPWAAAASAVALASAVARYSDQTSGVPDWPSFFMAPAIGVPSLEKLM